MSANLVLTMWMTLCMSHHEAPVVAILPVTVRGVGVYYSYPPGGNPYASTITAEMRDSSLDWEETSPNAPLSARKAMSLAEATLNATLREKSDPSLKRSLACIQLVPLGGKKWCWAICYEWHTRVGGESGTPCDFRVFVLMDGKVVQPIRVKEEPEEGE